MGPKTRYLGPEIPDEELIWQDPVPKGNTDFNISNAKQMIKDSGLSITEMVETAWASASTYRCTDMRGGANGSRIRLAPQKDWQVNKPDQLRKVLGIYEEIAKEVNASIADIIVLAGSLGIEMASGKDVAFTPGRGDASIEKTDVDSFGVLEPLADGFRNFSKQDYSVSPEEMLLDKSQLMGLTAPEMTVLLGGFRSLGISSNSLGIFSKDTNKLSNIFFKCLLDMDIVWKPLGNKYIGTSRSNGNEVASASRVDLVLGSNSQLRAISEVYACNDSNQVFIHDFIKAWTKVMNFDRFDCV